MGTVFLPVFPWETIFTSFCLLPKTTKHFLQKTLPLKEFAFAGATFSIRELNPIVKGQNGNGIVASPFSVLISRFGISFLWLYDWKFFPYKTFRKIQTCLTHCLLIDSSAVISWTSPYVILGVSGLFCRFYYAPVTTVSGH